MLIRFIKPDPRAGTQARMDSSRGQQFIDAGQAERVNENAAPVKDAPPPAETQDVKPARKRSK